MNAISVLHPYKYEGMWVFDDPNVGLCREPFVAGIDEMINRFVKDIPDAAKGFRLLFSPTPFPGVGSSRVDLQACKLEYSIVSPK